MEPLTGSLRIAIGVGQLDHYWFCMIDLKD
jgi:hypothetical protein